MPGRRDGEDAMTATIGALKAPDSKRAREIAELVRDTETPLLFHHSSRVYYWGALTGRRRGLRFDHELLYAGAMFHDMGLTRRYANSHNRFEVDSANAARDFLRSYGIAESDIATSVDLHCAAYDPRHPAAHASCHRPCYGRRRDGRNGHRLSRVHGRRAQGRGSTLTRVRATSRRRSSRPSMMGCGTGPRLPLARSMRTCSPTRTLRSSRRISAA